MVTIGMLSHRKDPKTVFKSYAYAAAAKMEGVGFYFFSPGRVDFNNRTIFGWSYEKGQWIEKWRPFPDVILNASSPTTEKQKRIIKALRKIIPFTNQSIGDKMEVFRKIKAAKTFTDYIVPSIEISIVGDVFEFIHDYPEIVIKPCSGNKGENVFFVAKNKEDFIVQQDQKTMMNEIEFKDWINQLIKNRSYIIQPYIQSKTKNGLCYDFRLHVQKDGEGKWRITTIFPRIARQGIVSNLSNGGYTSKFEDFLKQEFDDQYYNVKRYLEQFAIVFSEHFDGLYQNSLDELGIDVGLDPDHKIWIYEVNWRPGSPVTFSLELDTAKQMIFYARYLAKTNRRRNKRPFPKKMTKDQTVNCTCRACNLRKINFKN